MITINDGIAAVNGSNVECLKKFLINEPLKDINRIIMTVSKILPVNNPSGHVDTISNNETWTAK